MASTDKSTPVPYAPANPPFTERTGELSRATWDELYRISERFTSLDKPAATSVSESKSVPVQPTVVWTRLLNTAIAYDWELPAGQMNATGVWECPQEGLYSITVIIEVSAFPVAGSRIYEATLRSTLRPIDGSADLVIFSKTGGPDEVALRLIANFLRPLNRGDQAWFDLDLTVVSFTGTVPILTILNVCRQASVK